MNLESAPEPISFSAQAARPIFRAVWAIETSKEHLRGTPSPGRRKERRGEKATDELVWFVSLSRKRQNSHLHRFLQRQGGHICLRHWQLFRHLPKCANLCCQKCNLQYVQQSIYAALNSLPKRSRLDCLSFELLT